MTVGELQEKVRAAWPTIAAAYREGLTPGLAAAMHTLPTDYDLGTEKLGMIVGVTKESFLTANPADRLVKQLCTAASLLGREVYSQAVGAGEKERPEGTRLYWLENWPFGLVEAPPPTEEEKVALGIVCQYKLSLHGAWQWLTEEERTAVLAKQSIERSNIKPPRGGFF